MSKTDNGAAPDQKPQKKPTNSDFFKSIVRQLEEYSVGGFILFYINPENGCPQTCMLFENQLHSIALQKYGSDWLGMMQNIYLDNVENGVRALLNPPKSDGTSE